MIFKPDEGYGFLQSSHTEDGKFRVTQLKTEFIKEFKGLFCAEDNGVGQVDEEVQRQMSEVYDFATSFLTDALDPKNHKVEILTKEEFSKKFSE